MTFFVINGMHKYIIFFFNITILLSGLFFAAPADAQQPYSAHSKLAAGSWYKISISETGVYKLTAADLPALNGTICSKIALYGNEGKMMNASNTSPRPDDLEPVAIEVHDANSNGLFEAEDYLLFYAEGPDVWRYSSRDQRFEYVVHAYANNNFYYLNCDQEPLPDEELRITDCPQMESNQADITRNTVAVYYGEENINTHKTGQIWVTDKFSSSTNKKNYTIKVPGMTASSRILARYGLASVSTSSSEFTVKYGNDANRYSFSTITNYIAATESYTSSMNGSFNVSITYTPHESNAAGYLDFIEINCEEPLTRLEGQFFIRNTKNLGADNISRFVVDGNGDGLKVWDITNPLQPMNQELATPSSSQFSFIASTAEPRSYIAFALSDILRPTDITLIENQDIHGAEVPEYVIVSHEDFMSQARRLAQIHYDNEGLSYLVVTQEQVFNEFSSGKKDPMAIRQMLRCLRAKSDDSLRPRYLLLFGKGTYDNRDHLGLGMSTVVTYETPSSFNNENGSYPSDDLYGYIDDRAVDEFDGLMSVSVGRLPAKDAAQAEHLVDKIEGYILRRDLERNDIRGDWRNYVALLADDADPSCPGDTNFASDSEITAQLIKRKYPQYNIDRIYADSYPQQSGADGSYYPDVNNALNQRMDYGCILLNYIGHGSSGYIGTERYMQLTDIERYANTDRLPFFVTSTCSFGRYDMTDDICGSEAFVLADAAGIGIVAAARPIVHMRSFNTDLCLSALNPDNSIGDALRHAKNAYGSHHSITLIGDPALRLSIPRNEIVVTNINGRPVSPEVTDSAEVLSSVTVEGEIRDHDGNLRTDFDGSIYPIVFDREVKCRTLANDNDSTEIDFSQQKSILFKGHSTVSGGKFSYTFTIPRDVAYRYDYAKLSHYARSNDDDATGQYGNIMFGGFNEDLVIEEVHPVVELYINDTNFRNGAITNETPTLYARLSDAVGINAAGSGLGHDITATIDNNPYSTVSLNDFFEPDIADSRNGEVRYTLGKLDEGEHTLTLKCWNIYNYSGSATIRFRVANDRSKEIGSFTAAPNPAHDQTVIRIEHNQPGSITAAHIDIFDMRGSLVRQFDADTTDASCTIAIPWNFTASNGAILPRSIYVARVTLTTTDGSKISQIAKIIRN